MGGAALKSVPSTPTSLWSKGPAEWEVVVFESVSDSFLARKAESSSVSLDGKLHILPSFLNQGQ